MTTGAEPVVGDSGPDAPGVVDPASSITPGRITLRSHQVEIGPWVHLAAERARLARPEFDHIEVSPQGATLGAEIAGVDLTGDIP